MSIGCCGAKDVEARGRCCWALLVLRDLWRLEAFSKLEAMTDLLGRGITEGTCVWTVNCWEVCVGSTSVIAAVGFAWFGVVGVCKNRWFADLALKLLEVNCLKNSNPHVLFHRRYVDDCFLIVKRDKVQTC